MKLKYFDFEFTSQLCLYINPLFWYDLWFCAIFWWHKFKVEVFFIIQIITKTNGLMTTTTIPFSFAHPKTLKKRYYMTRFVKT